MSIFPEDPPAGVDTPPLLIPILPPSAPVVTDAALPAEIRILPPPDGPSPEETITPPPTPDCFIDPPDMYTVPPGPFTPFPTAILMSPAVLDKEFPDSKNKLPEVPEVAVPVARVTSPDVLLKDETIVTAPLLDAEEIPVLITISPPISFLELPDDRVMLPPTPEDE
jgi:hypothetical protein